MAQLDYKVIRHSMGTQAQEDVGKDVVIVRSEEAITALLPSFEIGTIFRLAGFARMWEKNLDGGYTLIGEEEEA